ncbi:MAG: hypothetical protein KBT63_05165 [Porticoccaceae bacterium]|nr:hypothetical protein [Porticoccaceae bacterium]
MAGLIKNWLNGDTPSLRWLAFEDYARKVFGNEHEGWYREPMRYAAGLADANKVLGSQVVTFDFGAVFLANAALAKESQGADRIAAVLNNEGVKAFCNDAISAMAHQLNARVDLVLQLPSPSGLLITLGEDAANIDFDMLDDTATVLADMLRGFSELNIAGVVVAFTASGVDVGEESEACEVLQSVADHYDWIFALRLVGSELVGELSDLPADLVLFSALSLSELAEQKIPVGGGLSADFWGSGELPTQTRMCLYGDVPAGLDPKVVIERIAALP